MTCLKCQANVRSKGSQRKGLPMSSQQKIFFLMKCCQQSNWEQQMPYKWTWLNSSLFVFTETKGRLIVWLLRHSPETTMQNGGWGGGGVGGTDREKERKRKWSKDCRVEGAVRWLVHICGYYWGRLTVTLTIKLKDKRWWEDEMV